MEEAVFWLAFLILVEDKRWEYIFCYSVLLFSYHFVVFSHIYPNIIQKNTLKWMIILKSVYECM